MTYSGGRTEAEYLSCPDCPSEVIGPTGTTKLRYRVVHEATCPAWARYRLNLPGYTALPSGQVIMAGDPLPEGTTRVVSNGSPAPCGAVVTHRGPYRRRAAS